MIGPLWLWGVYRQWRCEKMLADVFGTSCDTYPARVWTLLTLRWFPHLRLIGAADWDAYWRSDLPCQVRDPVRMVADNRRLGHVGTHLENGDAEIGADFAGKPFGGG